ncbi:MAG: translation initiation factor [bacterium]
MKNPRIDTSGRQSNLHVPFAGLQLDGLREEIPKPEPPLPTQEPEKSHGRVVLRREKARRGGKTVIVVSDFDDKIPDADIKELARLARQACGCGGTVRSREIELQGNNPDKLRVFFQNAGFRVAGI